MKNTSNPEYYDAIGNYKALAMLRLLGEGTHFCGLFNGYLKVIGTPDEFLITWTTGKDRHNHKSSKKAITAKVTALGMAEIHTNNGTLETVTDETCMKLFETFMINKINKAFKKEYCN